MKIKKEFIDLIYNGDKNMNLEMVMIKKDYIKLKINISF